MSPCSEKIALLRAAMQENSIDLYIIPSTDPHLGENIPDHWRIIEWLTGFTGSAATVVVSELFAGLWTDSRYFIQAERQLAGTGISLMHAKLPEKKDFVAWIGDNAFDGERIALDGRIISIGLMRRIEKAIEGKNVSLDIDCDLISDIWTERPGMLLSVAFDHPLEFCGKDRSVKITEVREEMKKQGLNYHLLTSVDDIMWMLNIRGSDSKYSPLIKSYAIIDVEQILFFVEDRQIPLKLAMEFDKLGIVMLPYEEAAGMLSTLDEDSSLLITPGTTSAMLFNSIPHGVKIIEDISIPARLKSVKNSVEIRSIGNAVIKDGVALTKFFFWLENNNSSGSITELSAAEKLLSFRSEQAHFLSPSFSTIAAWNEHGALPHYSATAESDSIIGDKGIFLLDSGGQYFDGTTDITRTIAVGKPAPRQKSDFTYVLRGMIALARAKFPVGTRGVQLDILARKALWERGLNYGHGTGHGVGFCLNVHEGPQSISPGTGKEPNAVIEPGMLISDEPAIYREGEYGIRIENLILCYEDEESEFGKFLRFDTVSLCYIDKSLIDISLLDQNEIDWLNAYHAEVYEKLGPFLDKEEKVWLKEKTEPLR
jgi:Xaa-Pro aminopeptidase